MTNAHFTTTFTLTISILETNSRAYLTYGTIFCEIQPNVILYHKVEIIDC